MKTLKQEEIYCHQYRDFADLSAHLEEFIGNYYNRQRLHSALGYQTPQEFERHLAGRFRAVELDKPRPSSSSLRSRVQRPPRVRTCNRWKEPLHETGNDLSRHTEPCVFQAWRNLSVRCGLKPKSSQPGARCRLPLVGTGSQ
jgi:hypothetical protein